MRDERGACGNVSHGGIRNPLHKSKGCMMETLHLKLSAPYFYPTTGVPTARYHHKLEMDMSGRRDLSESLSAEYGTPHPEAVMESFVLSGNGKHFAYAVRGMPTMSVAVDNVKLFTGYDDIMKFTPIMDYHGNHIAFGGQRFGRWFVVVNGKEGSAYDGIGAESQIVFDKAGSNFAFSAYKRGKWFGGKWYVGLNNLKEFGPYDSVLGGKSIVFSPDGNILAYACKNKKRWRVYQNGTEMDSADDVMKGTIRFSRSGNSFSYILKDRGKLYVVVNNNKMGPYDDLWETGVIFDESGSHFAFVAKINGDWVVVIDEQNTLKWDSVGGIIFSSDGKRIAYAARLNNLWSVVVDGHVSERKYDLIGVSTPLFSPDGKRVAYTAKKGDGWYVVVDDSESDVYESLGLASLRFSTDSETYAFVGNKFGRSHLMVNKEELYSA